MSVIISTRYKVFLSLCNVCVCVCVCVCVWNLIIYSIIRNRCRSFGCFCDIEFLQEAMKMTEVKEVNLATFSYL